MDNQIKEFQKILKEDFGMDISKKEAFAISKNLLELFNLLSQENYEQTNKKD